MKPCPNAIGHPCEQTCGGTAAESDQPKLAGDTFTAIALFEIEGLNAVETQALIQKKYRITVDEHTRDGHNALRVSTHFYNTRHEIDQLISALQQVVGSGQSRQRAG